MARSEEDKRKATEQAKRTRDANRVVYKMTARKKGVEIADATIPQGRPPQSDPFWQEPWLTDTNLDAESEE